MNDYRAKTDKALNSRNEYSMLFNKRAIFNIKKLQRMASVHYLQNTASITAVTWECS